MKEKLQSILGKLAVLMEKYDDTVTISGKKFRKSEMSIYVLSLAFIVCCFLPYCCTSLFVKFSMNYFTMMDGKILIGLLIATSICTYLKKYLLSAILAVVGFGVYFVTSIYRLFAYSGIITVSVGFIILLILIAAIVIITAGMYAEAVNDSDIES